MLPDYSKGFGGKFGVQNDRMDKVRTRVCVYFSVEGLVLHVTSDIEQSASTFEDVEKLTPAYQKTKPVEAGEHRSSSAVC